MSEQSLLRPTCGNCRHWGTQEESGMHRHCNEPDNLRELGERLRAMWEACTRWTTLRG